MDGLDQYDERNPVGQRFLDEYEEAYGRRPEYCVPVMNRDFATVLLHAFADAHPLSPRGVKEALERVKMLPAAAGAPGTRLSFGKWTRRGWMGAGYLVARQLEPEFGSRISSGASGSSERDRAADPDLSDDAHPRRPRRAASVDTTSGLSACWALLGCVVVVAVIFIAHNARIGAVAARIANPAVRGAPRPVTPLFGWTHWLGRSRSERSSPWC